MIGFAVAVVLMLVAGPRGEDDGGPVYGAHAFLATAQTRAAGESSGVAPSHFDADVFWTHNDSGSGPRVYAFRLSAADRKRQVAADLGYVELSGAKSVDWEDIAAGPGDRLYVLDGGDNPPCVRTDKAIIRFVEPRPDPAGRRLSRAVPWEAARFEYPDLARPDTPTARHEDRFDAECLFVHPTTGDMYVVTKRDDRGQPVARLYRLPAASVRWDARTVHVLQFVTDLAKQVPGTDFGGLAGMVTGGAVSADGKRVVIRTYLAACVFTLPAGRPFEEVFQQKPQVINLVGEPQGEGICFARNGDLISTSESPRRGPRFPIFITPVTTHPASAPTP